MTDSPKAVFLSYAREDADSAKRIADALRGFGLEVWFDKSELRGGDQWDEKIRGQIKACALFIPVISQITQTRDEAYFRLEWKLAEDRTHLMAPGKAFIVPVVIDDTPESTPAVPDSFKKSQWTRLPGGEPTTAFIEQVKRLLDGPRKPTLKSGQPKPPAFVPAVKAATETNSEATPAKVGRRVPAAAWGIALIAVVVLVVGGVMWRRSPKSATAAATGTRPPAAASVAPAPSSQPPSPAPKASDKSIAVLPFTNMSEEKDSAYFTDGIQEDILTNLALIRELRVVSRTSVMGYRGTTKPMRQIAQELGVAYILEGSVRRAGNKVRVTGQLIHAATDEHVWAATYDRDLTDIFAIQSELSQQIAAALQTALSPEEKKLIEHRPTDNIAAYDAYTKARQILSTGTQAGFDNLEPLLKTAVLLDPKFAQAWAELGSVYARRYFDYWDHTPACLASAKAAIDKAVALAPGDPVVIQKLGDYYYYGLRDYTRATQQYQQLAGQYPNSAPAQASLAFIHRRQGRWAEAMAELRRAVQLEPRNLRYSTALVETLLSLRHYGEAAALQQEIIAQSPSGPRQIFTAAWIPLVRQGSMQELEKKLSELDKDTTFAPQAAFIRRRFLLLKGDLGPLLAATRQLREKNTKGEQAWNEDVSYASLLYLHGEKGEAQNLVNQALAAGKQEAETKPDSSTWVQLSMAYAVLENKSEALRCAQAAKDFMPEADDAMAGPDYSLNYARILAWFGEKDQALTELTRLLRTPGGANVHLLRRDLTLRNLQGDPRFEALLNDPQNNAPLL